MMDDFGVIDMSPQRRRLWVTPELRANSTLTVVTQIGPHTPLALLFQVGSSVTQCFNEDGTPRSPC